MSEQKREPNSELEITGNVEHILDNTVSEMPEPSPVADIIQEKNTKESENEKIIPTAEKRNKDGSVPKKRGRKPQVPGTGPKAVDRPGLSGVATAGERAQANQDAERLATAEMVVTMMEISGTALAGDAGRMEVSVEKPALISVWDKYLLSKNINDIPPGVMLLIMTGQYYGRVLTAPEAIPKTTKIRNWFQNKIIGIFMRRKNARINSRDDSQRENNAGENAGKEVSTKRK